MLYVILDPGADYPAAMIGFLGSHGLRAVAVHTDPGRLMGFRHMYAPMLAPFVEDEYLLPEHESLEDLAAAILGDHPGGFQGIIPWDEMTTELGAELGEHLGIAWNPREVIHRFRNKYAMKAFLREHGDMRINASRVVDSDEEALEFAGELERWPLVVKPTEGAGSRAVFFVEGPEELVLRCNQVAAAGNGQVLIEEYVGGDEYVVNGIVDAAGSLLVTDVWRYDRREFHGVPNLYYQTFKVSSYEPYFDDLGRYAAEVVQCLGLRRAPIHMELKLDEEGPCLVEVGARFGGGNHPALSSELHGRSLFELAACHYMAELPVSPTDVDYARYDSLHVRILSGVQSEPLPMIRGLVGMPEVQALPSFHGFSELKPPGMPLPISVDLDTRSYVTFLMHPDPHQVEHDAAAVRELLRYV